MRIQCMCPSCYRTLYRTWGSRKYWRDYISSSQLHTLHNSHQSGRMAKCNWRTYLLLCMKHNSFHTISMFPKIETSSIRCHNSRNSQGIPHRLSSYYPYISRTCSWLMHTLQHSLCRSRVNPPYTICNCQSRSDIFIPLNSVRSSMSYTGWNLNKRRNPLDSLLFA